MNLVVALKLGRVSNLPTVWTNVLAGAALAGGSLSPSWAGMLVAAATLFYVGGMYLNDAFDHGIDARERPERPIPSGTVNAATVFASGFAMLAGGLGLLGAGAVLVPLSGSAGGMLAAAVVLCLLIVLYDWRHKGNPLSPVIMGGCRMATYVTAGFAAVATPGPWLWWGGLALGAWVAGLTYVAKQESLDRLGNLWPLGLLAGTLALGGHLAWGAGAGALAAWGVLCALTLFALFLLKRRAKGDVGRAVVTLIAGIALLDALFLFQVGGLGLGALALGAFVATLFLQRFVPGT